MTLVNHEIVEAPGSAPDRQLFVLHGIYGAGRNWGTVARRLVRSRPRWRCVLVDLRSHGRSPALRPHTLEACAGDLSRLEGRIGEADGVLGHSFGGKVAMMWAQAMGGRTAGGGSGAAVRVAGRADGKPAQRLPDAPTVAAHPSRRQLWIVDSSPGAGHPRGGAWRMLEVLRRHPGPFGSRAEAVAAVESEGFSRAVAQWMAMNVVRGGAGPGERAVRGDGGEQRAGVNDGGAVRGGPSSASGRDGWVRAGSGSSSGGLLWSIDPEVMEALIRDYFRHDLWPIVDAPPPGLSVHIVRALGSSVLNAAAAARIRRAGARTGRVALHDVEGGHWVNVENPAALHGVLAAGLGEGLGTGLAG